MLDNTPVFIDLDKRRRLAMNVNTEILIKKAGGLDAPLVDTIGKRRNETTGEDEAVLEVNIENVRLYLWACLQSANPAEALTLEEVGALMRKRSKIAEAIAALVVLRAQYYGDGGDDKGEADAPAGA
ncbi:MAG: hypothetical protein WCA44_17890 [Acidobacteriaceae bacterium]